MSERGFALPAMLAILAITVVAVIFLYTKSTGIGSVGEATRKATKVLTGGGGFSFDENTPGYENYLQLIQGCPSKDCIPSIDEPVFESISEADKWLEDGDIVFSLDYKGEARAYPQRILNWHEIVNDVVAGDPLAITFCPLCGSALTFDSKVDGQVLEFGVSGKLHNNDLVMYDRQTESLWQQITGEAIVGELFGKKLKQIPTDTMLWSQFKEEHQGGKVLSRDTGFSRNYDKYPYGTYEEDRSVNFPIEGGVDQTIHPKTVVYGVKVGDVSKAFTEDKLKSEKEIEDTVGGVRIKITYDNGKVRAENRDSKEEIVTTRLFWFAWKAFHLDTGLY